MKRLCILTVFLLLASPISTRIFAVEDSVFGPQRFNRTKGAPNEYADSFAGVAGVASIKIKNGNDKGRNRISSAYILINGEQIFGPSDFNQKVDSLTKTIELTTQNSISVKMKSKPSSYITIEIMAGEKNKVTVCEKLQLESGQNSILWDVPMIYNDKYFKPGMGYQMNVKAMSTYSSYPHIEKLITHTLFFD